MNKIWGGVLQIVIAIFIADFLVACGHWIEDNYLVYNKNIEISVANELHHFVPRLVTRKSNIECLFNTVRIIPVWLLLIYIIRGKEWIGKHTIFVTVSSLIILISEILHKAAHLRDCEKSQYIKFLQDIGLIISSEQHRIHHTSARVTKNYGVILGFTNQIYDGLGIWSFLESIFPSCKKANSYPLQPHFNDECPRKLTKEDREFYETLLHQIHAQELIPKCN